ncbi:Nn.00g036780.m01.CDS01 [Neocucurbitaria sp. VM-36]
MANRRGYTSNDPIDLDEFPDDRDYPPASRLPRARRPSRHSNPPFGVEVISLSDDEQDSRDDVEEAAPSAWAAAQTRRGASNRIISIDNSTFPPRREPDPRLGDVSRSPSTKPPQSSHTSRLSDGQDPPVLGEEEYVKTKEPSKWGPATSTDPFRHPNATSSNKAIHLRLSDMGAKPPNSALSIATQDSDTSPRRLSPELPTAAPIVAAQKQALESFPNAVSSLRTSTPVSIVESLQNEPPASTIPTRSPVSTDQSTHELADLNFAHTLPAPTPSQTWDTSKGAAERQASNPRRGFKSPIGEFTDHEREQTTSSRVNTRPRIERTNTDNEARMNSNPTSFNSTEASSFQVPNVIRTQPKQRAVKTVKRREDRGPSAVHPAKQHNRDLAKNAVPSYKLQKDLIAPQRNIASSEHSDSSMRQGRSKETSDDIRAIAMSDATVERGTRQFAFRLPPVVGKQNINPPLSGANTERTPSTAGPSTQLSINRSEECHQSSLAPNAQAKAMPSPAAPVTLPQSNTQAEGLNASGSSTSGPAVSERIPVLADDIDAMRSAVEDCLKSILEGRRKAHANLTEMRMKCQRICQEREIRAQRRQQKGPVPPALPKQYVQSVSPFVGIAPIQVSFDKKPSSRHRDISQEIFTKAKPKDIIVRSAWAAPTTTYKSEVVCIPTFKEFISLKDNILADNESKLLATPYFHDEDDDSREKLLKLLPHRYEMKHDEKGPLDLRTEQCRFYKDSIEAFLCKIGITWDDVLYWLLASERLIKLVNGGSPGAHQFEHLLLDRGKYESEAFERGETAQEAVLFLRDSKKWQEFLSQLQEPTAKNLRLSAIACAAVLKECAFSTWYLAQQSETILMHVSRKTKHAPAVLDFKYRDVACRVCHQHNCLIHGELREVPHDSWESESEADDSATLDSELSDDRDDSFQRKHSQGDSQLGHHDDDDDEDEDVEDGFLPAHVDNDPDIEKIINYKLPANPNAFGAYAEPEMIECRGSKPPEGKFNSQWWLQHSYTHMWEKRKPFFPCSHEGSCERAQCRCFRENINCEKSWKRTCALSTCLCFKFRRECDADLCGTCGATEILDPVNRYNEDVIEGRCCNVAIQRGVPRRTLLGHSEVHGFGLYMGEDIKKDEYIGEYLGETISGREGNRRLTIYEYQQTMYLFKLNAKQEVDATFMGNKMRFINNADRRFTNCYAKNLFCNTVFRLALYASTNIKAGTELYFDYNYPKETTRDFKQPKGKVVAVKDTVKQTKPKGQGKSSDTSFHKSSTSSSLGQQSEINDYRIEVLKRARAEKARKREARLAEQVSEEPAPSHRPGRQQARKTAHTHRSNQPQQVRGVKTVRRSASRNNSNTSKTRTEADESNLEAGVSAQVVQDTDDDDDDFILQEPQVDDYDLALSDNEDHTIEDSESDTIGRNRGGQGKRLSMAPVVAVKKKMGGARPGAGRKRKRPVVVDSDGE